MTEMQNNAIKKIQDELKAFDDSKCSDKKAIAVSTYVANALQDFCKQDERFAKVVFLFKRTLTDCLKTIMKDVGNAISDIDTYRKAVQFYFPDSHIQMMMSISTGEAPSDEEISKEPEKPKKPKVADKKPIKKAPPKEPKKKDDDCIQLTF